MGALPAFAIILVAVCGSLINGIRFRRGSGSKVFLRWYRNPDMPAIWRGVSAVEPLITAWLLPPVVLATAVAAGAGSLVGPLPDRIVGLLAFGGGAWFLLVIGGGIVIGYRPPTRLLPRWLVADDERAGYRPAPPGLFDKAVLILLGIPLIVSGCLMALVALGFALGVIRRVGT